MNASELKYNILSVDPETHFFDRKTMHFFGDTMRNFGVRATTVTTNYDADGNYVGKDGVTVECWELYRKRAVKHGNKGSFYFSKETFTRIYPAQ